MSTLSNLLKKVEAKDPQLAADLEREVKALTGRRAFGLNFERHVPEAVELPGRPARKGDKVRLLAERGKPPQSVDQRLWKVSEIRRSDSGRLATLVRPASPDAEPEVTTRCVDDLVVVAEFHDPIYPGLESTGKVERGGDKPFHTVINAENFHALQALLYTHEGKLSAVLDGLMARHQSAVEAATYGLLEVEGETVVAGMNMRSVNVAGVFSEVADDRAVEADFKNAGRVLSPDIARKYADHIAVPTEDDDGLFDAHIKVAALAQVDGVRTDLEREADALARKWLDECRVAIKGLTDERRAVYDEIIAMSADPQRIDILRPKVRSEETEDSAGNKVPTQPRHLMADPSGQFPTGSLNNWEVSVLESEMRHGLLAWYRNPGRASEDSLAVAYQDGKGNWRRMCPDFVFFSGDEHDVKVSLVDPHGFHLGDALPKLRGLANYAVEYGGHFHRIEAVAQMRDAALRVLDLQKESVRQAIQDADDAEQLYLSDAASNY